MGCSPDQLVIEPIVQLILLPVKDEGINYSFEMATIQFLIEALDGSITKCVGEINKRRLVQWEINRISVKVKMCFLKFLSTNV